jgi:hypothetical protein
LPFSHLYLDHNHFFAKWQSGGIFMLKHISFIPSVNQNQFRLMLLGGFISVGGLAGPAVATQLSNGQMIFDHAPRLVRSTAVHPQTQVPGSYQFTIAVPTNAGAPLKAVTIAQDVGQQRINLDTSKSTAFLGSTLAGGPALALSPIGGSQPDQNQVTVVFAQPVQPGQTVTVSLNSERNPMMGGVYLFGVTAYPAGQNSPGLFLGHGRVQLYDQSQ